MLWTLCISTLFASLGAEPAQASGRHNRTNMYVITQTVEASDIYESVTVPCQDPFNCRVWYRYDDRGLSLLTNGHEAVINSSGKYYVKKTGDPRANTTYNNNLVIRFPRVGDTGVYVCDRDYIAPNGSSNIIEKTSAVHLIVEGCKDMTATAITTVWVLLTSFLLCLCVDKIRKTRLKGELIWENFRLNKAMRVFFVPFATIYVNIGTLQIVYAMGIDDCNGKRGLMREGRGLGFFGLGILLIYLIINAFLSIRYCSSKGVRHLWLRNLRDGDNTVDEDKDENLNGPLPDPTVVEDIKSIGAIKGMVSTSATEVFMITSSALYRFTTTPTDFDSGSRLECYKRFDSEHELITLAKSETGVVICSQINAKWKSQFLFVNILERRMHECNAFYSRVSWVLQSQCKRFWYLTRPDKGNLYKIGQHNSAKGLYRTMRSGVFRRPMSVVQNSKFQLIVADAANGDVVVLKESGRYLTSLKPSVPVYLQSPMAECNKLAIGPDDRIYVAGPHSDHIIEFSADFKFERDIQMIPQSGGGIHSIMVHNNILYVAHGDEMSLFALKTRRWTTFA